MIKFTDRVMDKWALIFILFGIVGLFVIPFWHDAVIPIVIAFMFAAFISRNTIDQTRKATVPLMVIVAKSGELYVESDNLSMEMTKKVGELLHVFKSRTDNPIITMAPIIMELTELMKNGVAIHKKADELAEYAKQYANHLENLG